MGADYSCMHNSSMGTGNSTHMHGGMECVIYGMQDFMTGNTLCNEQDPDKPCFCCKSHTNNDDGNCPDMHCADKMGMDYTCVKNSKISSTMECEFNYPDYCNGANSNTSDPCFCCKEMPGCPGDGANCTVLGSGYSCVSKSMIDTTLMDCMFKNTTLCNENDPMNPCYCCKEKACPDLGCSKHGKNFTCFAAADVNLDTMDCAPLDGMGLGLCNDNPLLTTADMPCRCCKLKKNCTDVGCSSTYPGYQCMNEKDATDYPKDCMRHDSSLCSSGAGKIQIPKIK